ncbi:hypothetical protein DPMN_015740 [Dreissena polymorpha]|uniref:Uncharacterized protein n=1 Tax=Dreissena polymorpha TaxID=45954 RepID=A0A9D4N9R2_DREPO|nr:hypothetical protein DPMN_015740 [Dreissena polymorpha]
MLDNITQCISAVKFREGVRSRVLLVPVSPLQEVKDPASLASHALSKRDEDYVREVWLRSKRFNDAHVDGIRGHGILRHTTQHSKPKHRSPRIT